MTEFNQRVVNAVVAAYEAVSAHQEEINKLNVFPIPDGDTGTNVTLTMQNVVKELDKLGANPDKAQILRALKQGSLMGARGNSGVITSQILRGFADGAQEQTELCPDALAAIFESAQEVAYQAVRKPVEGTILTVIKDMATYARKACEQGDSIDEMLRGIAVEGMDSVRRTPELMATLKENGVVDSGGLALAVMIEGAVDSFLGVEAPSAPDSSLFRIKSSGIVAIEQNDDWKDHNFRYCTEFLFKSDTLDVEEAYEYLESIGDCQLVVGDHPDFKVHVHTDQPGHVLQWMIERGQPHEIFIHNMDMQSEERLESIVAESQGGIIDGIDDDGEVKDIGFVAVAVGRGSIAILRSLGVDKIVSGGQTMNPSTEDIVNAVNSVNAKSVIVLPSNKNIIMSANAATGITNKPCRVVPTTSTPQTFSAIIAAVPGLSLDDCAQTMSESIDFIYSGEVTTAVKDAVGDGGMKIKKGDVMGIVEDAIKVVGNDVHQVCIEVIDKLAAHDDLSNITLLAGQDMGDAEFEQLQEYVDRHYPDLEVDAIRGEQPLYPLVVSVE